MNQFDLKDYLKDNKLLKEDKESLLNEELISVTSFLIAAGGFWSSFKAWVASKGVIIASASAGAVIATFIRLGYLGFTSLLVKYMKDRFNMETKEIFPVIWNFGLSLIRGTQQYKDRKEEENSLFRDLNNYHKEARKNKYTTNKGINVVELLNKLSNTKFYTLGTEFYEKTIKELEEGIDILERILNYMLGDKFRSAIVDKRTLPAMAKKLFEEEEESFIQQKEKLEEALKITKGRFKEYKELKSVKTLNPDKRRNKR